MGEISISVGNIGRFDYETKLADDRNPKTEYVSMFDFRNAGKTLFGDTPWWQTIHFSSPESIDELIEALTYARMRTRNSLYIPSDKHEGIVGATARANNECKATKTDEGWKCEFCGEITSAKYERPKVCCGCGAFFDRYEDSE